MVLPALEWCVPPLRRELPRRLRSYGLMRQTITLSTSFNAVRLMWWVFAGCCQPLLRDGPSRRYLYESFLGCLTPYHGAIYGAHTRFFP